MGVDGRGESGAPGHPALPPRCGGASWPRRPEAGLSRRSPQPPAGGHTERVERRQQGHKVQVAAEGPSETEKEQPVRERKTRRVPCSRREERMQEGVSTKALRFQGAA